VDPAAERVQRKGLKLSAGQFIYSFEVAEHFSFNKTCTNYQPIKKRIQLFKNITFCRP
jgi:hypothetical protein